MKRRMISQRASICSPLFAAILVLAVTSPVLGVDWVANLGRWFDAQNWDSMAVPSSADDAVINNGGTATFDGPDAADLNAARLRIGTDGGTGALQIGLASGNAALNLETALDVGVSTAGSGPSTGSLDAGSADMIGTGVDVRVGVTSTADNATGVLDGANVSNFGGFHQLGVSSGSGDASAIVRGTALAGVGLEGLEVGLALDSGNATANVMGDWSTSIDPNFQLRIGVSEGLGSADATLRDVGTGSSMVPLIAFDVGVATHGGSATGRYLGWRRARFAGAARFGVSVGDGDANAEVRSDRLSPSFLAISLGPLTSLDLGVATGLGNASGVVEIAEGYSADAVNLGLSIGAGFGSGSLSSDFGLSSVGTLNMGAGGRLGFDVRGGARATAASADTGTTDVYSALDVSTAQLDGSIVLTFLVVPSGPQVFELIRSGSITGLTGDFNNVEIRNLNQGYTASSGIVVDGGVEKYVVTLSGAPIACDWSGANGDWFDESNWSSPLAPTRGDVTTIANGQEVSAAAPLAPGPMEVLNLGVGVDGGPGTLTSNAVDLTATQGVTIGRIRSTHNAGDTTTGTATLTDASILLATEPFPQGLDATDPTERFTGLGVAVAEGVGTVDGTLSLVNGSVDSLDPEGAQFLVGSAIGTSAAPTTANGVFTLDGGGVATSSIDVLGFDVGFATANPNAATPANAATSASVDISDATIVSEFPVRVGSAFALSSGSLASSQVDVSLEGVSAPETYWQVGRTQGFDGAVAESLVDLTITDTTLGGLEIVDTVAAFTEADVTATALATLTNVTLEDSVQSFTVCDSVDAFGASVTEATADVTIQSSSISPRNVRFVDVSEFSDGGSVSTDCVVSVVDSQMNASRSVTIGNIESFGGPASANVDVTFDNSSLSGGNTVAFVSPVSAEFTSMASANANVAISLLNGSELTTSILEIASQISAKDGASVSTIASVDVADSNVTVAQDFGFGVAVSDDTAVVDVSVALGLTNASVAIGGTLTSGVLTGSSAQVGNQLSATAFLTSSHVQAATLTQGSGSDLVFDLNGSNRVTPATVGDPSVYSAIDVGTADLGGDVVARFNFVPPSGVQSFDLVRGAMLSDSLISKTVEDLAPGFSVVSFGIVPDGADFVLRLTIDDTPLPTNDDCDNALAVSDGTFMGTTAGATNDGTGSCGESQQSTDVWYSYTAASAGTLVVTTCGTNDGPGQDQGLDTVLAVFDACGGVELACNDDWSGQACAGSDLGLSRDSAITLSVASGATVLIRVTQFFVSPEGDFLLNVDFVPDCATCIGLRGDVNGDNGVDIADAIATLGFLFNSGAQPQPCDAAGDSNGDNGVDVADAVYTLAFLFDGGAPPPAPGFPAPDCL